MFPTLRPPGNASPALADEGQATPSGRPGPTAAPRPGGELQGLRERSAGLPPAKLRFIEAGRHTFMPVRFHLPPPQVLRYSQSALYAKLMAAMVAGRDDHAEVLHQGRSFKVLTLRGVRRAGGEVRRPADSQAMDKRGLMAVQDGDDPRDANLYLAYASHRLGGKADPAAKAGQGGLARANAGSVT